MHAVMVLHALLRRLVDPPGRARTRRSRSLAGPPDHLAVYAFRAELKGHEEDRVSRRFALLLGVVAICGIVVGCGNGTPTGFDANGRPTQTLSSAANEVAAQAFATNNALALTRLEVPHATAADARVTLSNIGGYPTTVASISMGPTYGSAFVNYAVECSPSRRLDVSLALNWVHGHWRTLLYGPVPTVKEPADQPQTAELTPSPPPTASHRPAPILNPCRPATQGAPAAIWSCW